MSPILAILFFGSIASFADCAFFGDWPWPGADFRPEDPVCGYGRSNSCASPCEPTCSSYASGHLSQYCIQMCVSSCTCFGGHIIDDETGKCISPEQCKKNPTKKQSSTELNKKNLIANYLKEKKKEGKITTNNKKSS